MAEEQHSGSDYADAMRGILERAAEIDGAQGQVVETKQPFLTRPPVMATIFVVFVGVVIFNIRFTGRRAPPISPQAAEASAQVSVMVATQVVEQYREENGELPASLEDIGLAPDQFEYTPGQDGHFELSNQVGTARIRYDSRMGPASLLQELGVPVGPPPGGDGNR